MVKTFFKIASCPPSECLLAYCCSKADMLMLVLFDEGFAQLSFCVSETPFVSFRVVCVLCSGRLFEAGEA